MRRLILPALLLFPLMLAAQSGSHPELPADPARLDVAAPATDKVQLVSPAEGATVYEGTLRLVWHSVPFGSQYQIELSLDNFSTVGGVLGSFDTMLSVPTLAEHPRYWWRVRAMGFEGWGPFSDARSFFYRPFSAVPSLDEHGIESLLGITPNPAAGEATIGFHLDRSDDVTIDLLDHLGRHVRTAFAGRRDAGEHRALLDLRGISAGHYLYRLKTSASVVTKALVVW